MRDPLCHRRREGILIVPAFHQSREPTVPKSITRTMRAETHKPRLERFMADFGARLDTLAGALIEPLTEIGEATVRVLRFNLPDRVLQRRVLQQAGRYPIEA